MNEQKQFVCRNLMLAAYFLAKDNPAPIFEERDDMKTGTKRIVFLFDKTDKLMRDFYDYKQDEFMRSLLDKFYILKEQLYQLKRNEN